MMIRRGLSPMEHVGLRDDAAADRVAAALTRGRAASEPDRVRTRAALLPHYPSVRLTAGTMMRNSSISVSNCSG